MFIVIFYIAVLILFRLVNILLHKFLPLSRITVILNSYLIFFTGTYSSSVFRSSLYIWLMMELNYLYIALTKKHSRWSRIKGLLSNILFVTLTFISLYLSFRFARIPFFRISNNSWIFAAGGFMLILGGIFFRLWAVKTLGKYFRLTVVIQRGHRLISHGPYKSLRHPAYAGSFITLLGIGLVLENWLSLLTLIIINFIGFSVRTNYEESSLKEYFKGEYVEYKKHTYKLIPFVY